MAVVYTYDCSGLPTGISDDSPPPYYSTDVPPPAPEPGCYVAYAQGEWHQIALPVPPEQPETVTVDPLALMGVVQ